MKNAQVACKKNTIRSLGIIARAIGLIAVVLICL